MTQVQSFLENPREFELLTRLPTGDIRSNRLAIQQQETSITKIENKRPIYRGPVVLKKVPTYFDIEELGQDKRIDTIRRIIRKDQNPSKTVFLTTLDES
jgi:hypothetical protein